MIKTIPASLSEVDIETLKNSSYDWLKENIPHLEDAAEKKLGPDWSAKVQDYVLSDSSNIILSKKSLGSAYQDLVIQTILAYQNPEVGTLFNSLSTKLKSSIMDEERVFTNNFKLFENIVKTASLLNKTTPTDTERVQSRAEVIYRYSLLDAPDDKTPNSLTSRNSTSDEFQLLMNYVASKYPKVYKNGTVLYRIEVSLLRMLHALHWEPLMIEIYRRSLDEGVQIDTSKMVYLLENWNSLKDYPIAWSLEFSI